MDRDPLILGALGLAVGAAIGAMLPSTRYEDEYVGATRDRLKESAGEALHKGVEAAKDVAEETYKSARNEAEKQGLTTEDAKPLAERVAKVAETASETAKEATERKTGSTTTTANSSTAGNSKTAASSATGGSATTAGASKTSTGSKTTTQGSKTSKPAP